MGFFYDPPFSVQSDLAVAPRVNKTNTFFTVYRVFYKIETTINARNPIKLLIYFELSIFLEFLTYLFLNKTKEQKSRPQIKLNTSASNSFTEISVAIYVKRKLEIFCSKF